MIPVAELRAYIAQKLDGKHVDAFPSPHLILSDFFPASVFKELFDFNPFTANRGREMVSQSAMKKKLQDTPYHLRKQIDLGREDFVSDPAGQKFWRDINDTFLKDDWFAKLIYKIYPAFFDLRFGEAVLDPNFFGRLQSKMVVQRHDPGFNIGPHTDAPRRVFTCIFAFADRPGFEEYGTQFVRPVSRDVRCSGDLHHKASDFEVVKVADYSPNNFLVFFKTRHSFHAVKPLVREIPNQRYGMQLAYYEPAGGLLRDLSRPDLMEDRTSKPIFKFSALGRTLQLTRK